MQLLPILFLGTRLSYVLHERRHTIPVALSIRRGTHFLFAYPIVNPRRARGGQIFLDTVEFNILHEIRAIRSGLVVIQKATVRVSFLQSQNMYILPK